MIWHIYIKAKTIPECFNQGKIKKERKAKINVNIRTLLKKLLIGTEYYFLALKEILLYIICSNTSWKNNTLKYLSSFLSLSLTFTVCTQRFMQRHVGKIKENPFFLMLPHDFLKLFGVPLKTVAVVYILNIHH